MTRIRSTSSRRVQDRRGSSGGGGGGFSFPGLGGGGGGGIGLPTKMGGGGLVGLLIMAAIIFLPKLLGGSTNPVAAPVTDSATSDGPVECVTEAEQILCGADNDIHNFWTREFPEAFGGEYQPGAMVWFSNGVNTGCGPASSQTGPFYCPADGTLYFDIDFLAQMQEQFGAPGDLASQYIVAHEYGHHVQNITGTNQPPSDFNGTQNEWSVRVELQADCYAGIWAHDAAQRTDDQGRPLFEEGEIDEALNAAAAVGDDRIQQQTTGHVDPDSFTHGTSEQRVAAFRLGFDTGDVAECQI